MERARGEYSPRALQEMRSASRSPNKRSAIGERCCDEQEQREKQEERHAPVRVDELVVIRERGEGGGSGGGFGVFGVPTAPLSSSSSLVTPFKRFRADSLISPPKAGNVSSSSSTGGSETHGHFARRRAGPAFQSLSRDQSGTTTTTTRTAITVFKSNAGATTDYGIDSECSTQQSPLQSSRQSWQQSSQQSLQGDSMLFRGRECSPADVAELGSELLVCSETLEDQMDALDVGSFLSWRASPLLQQSNRTIVVTDNNNNNNSTLAAALRHRRKPRIRFDDDASYEIGLQDVFGEQTQEDDPLEELEDPLEVFVHLPSSGCCNCLCSDDHHDHEDLERSWQVPSPPPDAGFDPRSCSLGSDFDSDSDTVNESPFDAF